MRKSRRVLPVLENIEIIDAGSKGKSIAKYNQRVIFVQGAVPGDVCDLQVTKKKRAYYEARVIKFHSYSSQRTDAFCAHFGVCGGCKWQELAYASQLFYKQKEVKDNFKHLGKFEFPEVLPILPAPATEYYRNKLEFTFSNKRWLSKEEMDLQEGMGTNALGFHVPGRFDKVVDIKHCYLQAAPSNEIRNFIFTYAKENQLTFFDLRAQLGFLRNLIIRTSTTGDLMVILAVYEYLESDLFNLLNALKNQFPQISSLYYVHNPKANDTIQDLSIQLFYGQPYITEMMEGISFKIGPKSFYQTNSLQAYELYKVVRVFANLKASDVVYDLYTGTGTIANFVAKQCKKVIGVEYVPEAIEDAQLNSENNAIHNTAFFAGDMKDVFTAEFIQQHGKADVIITDPPRAGMHPDVVNVLMNLKAQKIVYVSCNPATQARDLNELTKLYRIVEIQPVDMFPHTHHLENVVLLELI